LAASHSHRQVMCRPPHEQAMGPTSTQGRGQCVGGGTIQPPRGAHQLAHSRPTARLCVQSD